LLISLEADFEAKGEYTGCTPLMLAVDEGGLPVVKLLLSNGADIHTRTKTNESILHIAVSRGTDDEDLKLLQFLIDNKAPVNAQDDEGSTPLHKAARLGNHKVVNLLIENGADVNLQNNKGHTPVVKI
jgi:ankyrin repeat protein